MQSYFEFGMSTLCGIPKITIQGTKQDWASMIDRVNQLDNYGLDWWTPGLRTSLDMFVKAFDGDIDKAFWKNLYKQDEMSGGPYVNGWINDFFPYTKTVANGQGYGKSKNISYKTKNRVLSQYADKRNRNGLKHYEYPASYSTVPFWWQYYDIKYDMELVGGILAIDQHSDTKAVRSRVGWAVREKNAMSTTPGQVSGAWE